EGRIEQVGPLEAVFRRPTSASVVEVLGLPNVFAARVVVVSPEGLTLDWDGLLLDAPPQPVEIGALVTAHIRPEDIKILYPDRPLMSTVRHNVVSGRIVRKQPGRSSQTLRVRLANEHEVDISFPSFTYTPLPLEPGQVIQVSLRREGLALLHSPEPRPSN
ncbi:MAG: TOBE domain-containing protein, partial [Anaerolineae bacterium]|nr:TOBE domain-containing protein [Anaerolineae bacterium]